MPQITQTLGGHLRTHASNPGAVQANPPPATPHLLSKERLRSMLIPLLGQDRRDEILCLGQLSITSNPSEAARHPMTGWESPWCLVPSALTA